MITVRDGKRYVHVGLKPRVENRPARSTHPPCGACKQPMAQETLGQLGQKMAVWHFCFNQDCLQKAKRV